MFAIARALFVIAALVALVLTFQGLRHKRRAYLQAALAILAVLAIATTAVLSVGLRQPAVAPAAPDSPFAQDAAQTARSVRPTAFDSVGDCLVQLQRLEDFYARHPDHFAAELAGLRTLHAAHPELTRDDPRHCSEIPDLRRQINEADAHIGALAPPRTGR